MFEKLMSLFRKDVGAPVHVGANPVYLERLTEGAMDRFEQFLKSAINADLNDKRLFCSFLKEGLQLTGMSVRDAALVFKTAPGTVSRWENGHTAPSVIARHAVVRELVARVSRIESSLSQAVEDEDVYITRRGEVRLKGDTMATSQELKAGWVAWLQAYGADKFYDAFMSNAQDAEGTCIHCGDYIYLDIAEGGGVPDWRTGSGDYGCNESPDTCDEGCGGHTPRKG